MGSAQYVIQVSAWILGLSPYLKSSLLGSPIVSDISITLRQASGN